MEWLKADQAWPIWSFPSFRMANCHPTSICFFCPRTATRRTVCVDFRPFLFPWLVFGYICLMYHLAFFAGFGPKWNTWQLPFATPLGQPIPILIVILPNTLSARLLALCNVSHQKLALKDAQVQVSRNSEAAKHRRWRPRGLASRCSGFGFRRFMMTRFVRA